MFIVLSISFRENPLYPNIDINTKLQDQLFITFIFKYTYHLQLSNVVFLKWQCVNVFGREHWPDTCDVIARSADLWNIQVRRHDGGSSGYTLGGA